MLKNIFIVISFILVSSLYGQGKKADITMFFTGGLEGRVLPFSIDNNPNQGGLPSIATIIEARRKVKGSVVVVVDTGNFMGTGSDTTLLDGMVELTGLNSIKYLISGTGPQEIMHSKAFFDKFNGKAEFYVLTGNVGLKKGGEALSDESRIESVGGIAGIKVGFFSVMSEEAADMISSKARSEFTIKDPLESATKIVNDLKRKKVDLIVALTYLGVNRMNGLNCTTLANQLPDIDIILDSYDGVKSDTPIEMGRTKIIQVAKHGLYLGELKIEYAGGEIKSLELNQIPNNNGLESEPIEQNSAVKSAIETALKPKTMALKKVVGRLNKSILTNEGIRDGETGLGNLICDAMVALTEADVAFQNAGGIGADNIKAGSISRSSLDKLIKFDNTVYIYELTGNQIVDILKFSMDRIGYGPFLQVGGIRFQYSKGMRDLSGVTIGGKEIEGNALYKVAVNSWLAEGGDGYYFFRNAKRTEFNLHHRELVYNYIQIKKTVIANVDGRITIIE